AGGDGICRPLRSRIVEPLGSVRRVGMVSEYQAGTRPIFRVTYGMQGEPVAVSQNENVTWLTQEAYDRLKKEYEELSGPGRIEIAKKIEAAREEGDLRENGGYHAAKDEQGKLEAR